LPASAAMRVVARWTLFRRRIDDGLDVAVGGEFPRSSRRPGSGIYLYRERAARLSSETGIAGGDVDGIGPQRRVRQPRSDHQPMPTTGDAQLAGVRGSRFSIASMTFIACLCFHARSHARPCGRRFASTASRAMRASVSPIAAAHPDAADAFALDDHREAAFHGGPPLGARGEREPDRMGDIERLRLPAPPG